MSSEKFFCLTVYIVPKQISTSSILKHKKLSNRGLCGNCYGKQFSGLVNKIQFSKT